MHRTRLLATLFILLVAASLPTAAAAHAAGEVPQPYAAAFSHRLIVELASPPLVASPAAQPGANAAGAPPARLDVATPEAVAYLQRLEAEQAEFASRLAEAIPGAHIATYVDENGQSREATYRILVNAVAVDAGPDADVETLERRLALLPGVKTVYRDYAHAPDLYASLPLIDVNAAWSNSAVGGQSHAGQGVKFASMDGGVHHLAPMFDGTGYSYPSGFPKGDTTNTNGKIIVSRAYFRPWDPPSPGDEHTWPGTQGTPHGVHTSSIAAGEPVNATYLGAVQPISGVAPRAYVMSYRVFYNSVTNDGSFYSVEGVKALEDIVSDGADILNCSWGAGPVSLGGPGDLVDEALRNAVRSGVFVAVSDGNNGPDPATGDHSSPDYINVAASTTSGTFVPGTLQVTQPSPAPADLQTVAYGMALFGTALPVGGYVGPWAYVPAVSVSPFNASGCSPFPAGTFSGKAAVMIGGACYYSTQVLNAQRAGAAFAVIYNAPARGDTVGNMSPGPDASQVTISSLIIGNTNGTHAVNWYNAHPGAAQLRIHAVAYQAGSTPDVIASFSSRGPGVGNVLKPDIAAPGVNILAQGFTPNVTGEARHLGWGQASGTSMAAPHVAGAAILLTQIHPTWTPAMIKSALMSTSQYLGIYVDTARTVPAQPLDMGAGRLDLTKAADPGVILDPPSLSFGPVPGTTTRAITVTVTSVATATETYTVTSLYTGGGYSQTTALPGVSFSPAQITLPPGGRAFLRITWAAASAGGSGDHQGYIVLSGPHHNAHLPAWIRVLPSPAANSALLIENDGHNTGLANYGSYYTAALAALGVTYDVWDADNLRAIPDAAYLARYAVVIYETGDNRIRYSNLAPYGPGLDSLHEYVAGGGRLLALGQDLAHLVAADTYPPSGAPTFYWWALGTEWLQESVNGSSVSATGPQLLNGLPGTPFAGLSLDMSARGDGAGNLKSIDEIGLIIGKNACDGPGSPGLCQDSIRPMMKYGGSGTFVDQGYIAFAHRDQPSLERPQVSWAGHTIYFSFGMEGVNNLGATSRAGFLGRAMQAVQDTATVAITPTIAPANQSSTFTARMQSLFGGAAVTYRWDFGDGTPLTAPNASATVSHIYTRPGAFTVRVEAVNAFGTRALGSVSATVGRRMYLPLVRR